MPVPLATRFTATRCDSFNLLILAAANVLRAPFFFGEYDPLPAAAVQHTLILFLFYSPSPPSTGATPATSLAHTPSRMLSLTRRSLNVVLPAARRSLALSKAVAVSARPTSFPIVSCAKDWRAADVPSLAATVKISLPSDAADELREHVTAVAAAEPDVEKVTVDATRLPLASAFLQRVERELLVEGPGLAILSPTPGIDSIHEVTPRL